MLYPHPDDQALPLEERRWQCRCHPAWTGTEYQAHEHLRLEHPDLYGPLSRAQVVPRRIRRRKGRKR